MALPSSVMSLCAGGGGLDLGVNRAIPSVRTVCYVENEVTASAVLAGHMEAGDVPAAPLWTDLRTFDGKPWRGVVDTVIGGYPCQPFSSAGKRLGADDPRHLWPHVARIVAEVEPEWCFFENVGAHLRLGFHEVARDLQGMGYRVAATLLTAEEVGASHSRERLFILATNATGERLTQSRHDWSNPNHGEAPIPWRTSDALDALGGGAVRVVCREHDGVAGGVGISRSDQLRILGNGVVPAQAATAIGLLMEAHLG